MQTAQQQEEEQQYVNEKLKEYDHVFDTVLSTFSRLNSRGFLETSKTNYDKVGRGCLYIHYGSYEEMLNSDQHRIIYVDTKTAETFNYPLVVDHIHAYDPSYTFVLLVGCDVPDKNITLFKSAEVHCVDSVCGKCGKSGAPKRCPRCKTPYCNQLCQKQDWPVHRLKCIPQQL